MNLAGTCVIHRDSGGHHLYLFPTDYAGNPPKTIILNVTSLRHWKDQTLILQPGDHSFIIKESVIAYEKARLLKKYQVERVLREGIAQPPASTELLIRITDGLTKSPFTPNKVKAFYQKYFGKVAVNPSHRPAP